MQELLSQNPGFALRSTTKPFAVMSSTAPKPSTSTQARSLKRPSGQVIMSVLLLSMLPSVHLRCWLGGRKGIRPVKN